jgi:hypothetical protein
LLNEGFRNHVNCQDRNCLTCNAAPPIINTKIVKNLVASLCKVDEETVDKKPMKKSKINGELKKTPGPVKNITQKRGKELAGATSGTINKGKVASRATEVDQTVKRRNK